MPASCGSPALRNQRLSACSPLRFHAMFSACADASPAATIACRQTDVMTSTVCD